METNRLILGMLVLLYSLLAMTGCPAPLSFSGVRSPSVTTDGAGGIIVAYQINEGENRITYVQKLAPSGEALWAGRGVTLYSELGPAEGGVTSALLVNSESGNTILVWEQADSIWAQKIDPEGRFLWGSGKVWITEGTFSLKAISDGSGGVVMAWSGSYDNLCLQRIDNQGSILWSVKKPLMQSRPFDISCDGWGNTFLVWEDRHFNVLLQKLDAMGKVSWLSESLLLSELHGPGVGMASIISDGADGAIVAWISSMSSDDKVGITGQELYTQRISAEGKTLWERGGLPIRSVGQKGSIPYEPQMVNDNAGGVFIVWKEDMSVYTQRVDAAGKILWGKDGIEVWNGEGSPRSPQLSATTDGSGGLIVVWNYIEKGKRVDQSPSLRAQRLDPSGKKIWGENGTLVTTAFQGYLTPARIAPDNNGGVIVSWAAGKSIHKASFSYVQKIDPDGNRLWGDEGIRLGH
jgi:hypothetical protein